MVLEKQSNIWIDCVRKNVINQLSVVDLGSNFIVHNLAQMAGNKDKVRSVY